ncbi:MAG: hypothetical protein JSS86_00240 [Cyanobacteria bacterium SZAS LIN-2]|nr:hypothetical protein [Cyanobacteria bacterium SZAS LIN-2]
MKALEREALLADREAVRTILAETPDSDPLGQLSFQSRLDAINARLEELERVVETRGSVALMFSGGPVLGSRAIDAIFVSNAVKTFQELVRKRVAGEERGELADFGPIPLRTQTNLAITDIVRGSMGFVLEESSHNENIADTAVKVAIDDVTQMVLSTSSENDAEFERAIESLDRRMHLALRKFFRTLDDGHASLRIVENERDVHLDVQSVHRGRMRVDAIDIREEESERLVGMITGILPDNHSFNMVLESGEHIRGTVAAAAVTAYLNSIQFPGEEPIVGRRWRVRMKIREVTEANSPPRRVYRLLGVLEPVARDVPPPRRRE